MTKFGIFSDLHFDHHALWDFDPAAYDVDLWLNAGDTATNMLIREYFITKGCPNQFFILGNHDFWNQDIHPPASYCHTREIEGIKIAGAPLWTDLSNPLDWLKYKDGLVDCRYMPIWKWNQSVYMEHHEYQKKFLFESGADIIISHHAPSYLSVSDQYRGDMYNCCFATELSEDILKMEKPPKLFIHGHMHSPKDYMIGKTRVICHPRGYPGENNFKDYKPLVVDI